MSPLSIATGLMGNKTPLGIPASSQARSTTGPNGPMEKNFEGIVFDEAKGRIADIRRIATPTEDTIKNALIETFTDCHMVLGKLVGLLEDDDIKIKVDSDEREIHINVPHDGFLAGRYNLMRDIITRAVETSSRLYKVDVTFDKKRRCSYKPRDLALSLFSPVTIYEPVEVQTAAESSSFARVAEFTERDEPNSDDLENIESEGV